MSKMKGSMFIPTAQMFVASTLSSIGLARGAQGRPYEMTPYWAHALYDYTTAFLGGATERLAIRVLYGMHKDLRRRALRKRERLAAAAKGKVE